MKAKSDLVNANEVEIAYNRICQVLKWLELVALELANFVLVLVEKLDVERLAVLINGAIVATIFALVLIEHSKTEDAVPALVPEGRSSTRIR